MWTRVWPYLVLAAEILIFYFKILFLPSKWGIPWDLPYYHQPLAYSMAEGFRNGILPLWEPHVYCGLPLHAVITTQMFYPPTIAAVLWSNLLGGKNLLYWLEVQTVLHVFAAGVFSYWLLRRLGLNRFPALTGATIAQLGPFFSSQIQHLGAIDAAAWIPLAFLAIVSANESNRLRWSAILGVALAMTVLAGFPAVTAVTFAATGMLTALLILFRRANWRLAIPLAGGYALAILLAAVQLIPTMELNRLSVSKYRGDWLGTGGGHPLQALISLVHPNYFGSFQFDSMTWKHPWNMTFLYMYCGIVGLICILVAIIRQRHRYAPVFTLLMVAALFWMLGDKTPVGRAIFPRLPMAMRAPLYAEYALPFFALSMAVLGGLGAQILTGKRRRLVQAGLLVAVAADLILVASSRPMNITDYSSGGGVGPDHMDGYEEIPRTVRALTRKTYPPSRIDTMNGSMNWAGDAALFKIPTATGNDPLALERYMQVRLSFCQGERWGRYYQVTDPSSPLLDLVNVRYIVTNSTIDPEVAARAKLVKVGVIPGQEIWENPEALPRFFLVQRVRRVAGMEAALDAIRAPSFDPKNEAVVEDFPSTVSLGKSAVGTVGTVEVSDYSATKVELIVDTPEPTFLVTSEVHYPGWNAAIDGEEHPLYMTNAAFRGLPVPAGRHTVVMRFQPKLLARSALVSAGGWVLLCALLLRGWILRTRSKRPSTSSAWSASTSA